MVTVSACSNVLFRLWAKYRAFLTRQTQWSRNPE